MHDNTGILCQRSRSVVNSDTRATLASAVQVQAKNVSSLAASLVAPHRTHASILLVSCD